MYRKYRLYAYTLKDSLYLNLYIYISIYMWYIYDFFHSTSIWIFVWKLCHSLFVSKSSLVSFASKQELQLVGNGRSLWAMLFESWLVCDDLRMWHGWWVTLAENRAVKGLFSFNFLRWQHFWRWEAFGVLILIKDLGSYLKKKYQIPKLQPFGDKQDTKWKNRGTSRVIYIKSFKILEVSE